MGESAVLTVAASDRSGRVLRNDNARAVARAGNYFVELRASDVIPLPEGATLMRLPGRVPVGADASSGEFVQAGPGEAVAAILPQGYTRTFVPAYVSKPGAPELPLFGYSSVAFVGDRMVVAAVRTDERDTWDPRHYDLPELPALVEAARVDHPGNRILRQLAKCAMEYNAIPLRTSSTGGGRPAYPYRLHAMHAASAASPNSLRVLPISSATH